MTPYQRVATTGLALTAFLVMGAACSQPGDSAKAPETEAARLAASADAHSFTVGTLAAVALKDGDIAIPNDGKVFGVGQPLATVQAALSAVQPADDQIHLSVQPLLVRDDDRTVLIDTGAGGQMGTANKLLSSLGAAGVQPAQVTDILISHGHGDHVGGLVGANGALNFPNATIRISSAEWTALQSQADMAALVAAIKPKVETFEPGDVVVPNITAVGTPGHTVGHTSFDIASGTEHLLYVGDVIHSSILSLQHPEWTLAWDGNADEGRTQRQGLLSRAADQNLRLYAVHFPFPGLGTVRRDGTGYAWVPEAQTLPAGQP